MADFTPAERRELDALRAPPNPFTLLKVCPGCTEVLAWPGSWSAAWPDHDFCGACLSVALRLQDARERSRIVRVAALCGFALDDADDGESDG